MNTLIKNATIIDGTASPRFSGSILIQDDLISGIFKSDVEEQNAVKNISIEKTIDAKNLILAPGFIDTHSHSDLQVLSKPNLLPKLCQGITTEILGQDGISMAPLPIEFIDTWKKNLAGLDGVDESIDWTYRTTDSYLNMIEKAKPALNEAYLLPHGNVRMEAMGLENRIANPQEIKKMCEIVERDMNSGCIGMSSGLIYIPCAYGETDELIEMCKIVKEHDGVFVVHQRSEADTILPSMDEIIRIGRESKVSIHFSHFKICGKKNWKYLPQVIKKINEAVAEGLSVSFDQYPYIAGSTMLGVILPPWVHSGGTDMAVERLKNLEIREKIIKDIKTGISGWDNFVEFAGTDGIYITSVNLEKNKKYIGKSLDEISELLGKTPLDAAMDLLIEENNAVGMVDFYGNEEHVKMLMNLPQMNLCTDGLLSGKPHPRVYGAFPRFLGKYVRDEKILSLEAAVRKVSGMAADSMKIKNRGYIKQGYKADIVIFDEETICDKGTFSAPEQFPQGIITVLVNGKVALDKGIATGIRNGSVIRKKQ